MMPTTWVEFMGIGEKPEPATIVVDAGNDDYRIALDLDAGNCYYQFRDLDEAMGTIWFPSFRRGLKKPNRRIDWYSGWTECNPIRQ